MRIIVCTYIVQHALCTTHKYISGGRLKLTLPQNLPNPLEISNMYTFTSGFCLRGLKYDFLVGKILLQGWKILRYLQTVPVNPQSVFPVRIFLREKYSYSRLRRREVVQQGGEKDVQRLEPPPPCPALDSSRLYRPRLHVGRQENPEDTWKKGN